MIDCGKAVENTMTQKKPRTSRRDILKWAGAAGATGLAGCTGGGGGDSETTTTTTSDGGDGGDSGTTTTGQQQDTVKAAWLYISEVGDLGWSWAHDQGRQWVEEEFDWLETDYSEAVAPADSTRVLEEYTNQDYDIIFGTTFEYMDPMLQVAKQNPDTLYEHNTGYKTHDNMGRYMGRIYQARYLAGMAAGSISEENLMGYVAAFPIPEVIRGINAFTLGARSVNSEVETKVRWINSWYDPTKNQQAAQSLIDEGVDVMAQHMDSPAAVRTAADAGIWSTGYDAPMGQFGGDKYITSPIWNWEVFYGPTLEAVKNGNWESDAYWEGYTAEYKDAGTLVGLDDWGPQVPQDVQDEVATAKQEIIDGSLDVWAGSKFEGKDDSFLFGEMGSFVEGVQGSVPE